MKEYSGQEIATQLDITRQAVAQTVKRALGKLYKQYCKEYPELSPFEIVAKVMSEFDIEINRKNFNCFPLRIKRLVIEAGKDYAQERNFVLPQNI
jgi:predicted DNA-binding protein YlxM (UPF0122 family)